MILVLGRTGQIARAIHEQVTEKRWSAREVHFAGRDEADFLKPETVVATIQKWNPRWVINCVAYTAVDKAETEPESAFQVNADTVGKIARLCSTSGSRLIHYSSDYVYDGAGHEARGEDQPLNPLSVYGKSKARGDEAVLASGTHALIFRTSWVYHHEGQNFVRTMLRLGAEREELSIVADQIGAPTSALAIARATLQAIRRVENEPFSGWGVYHMAGQGEASWHGFATEVFRLAREKGLPIRVRDVRSILTSQYPTPARRPLNSRLNQLKLREVLGVELPAWQESLAEVIDRIAADRVERKGEISQ